MDVWPAWDLQTFYPSEADECWTIRTHSDELTEPDVEIFMNLLLTKFGSYGNEYVKNNWF